MTKLEEALKRGKIKKKDIAFRVKLSLPTLKKYLASPEKFSVKQVLGISDLLGYPPLITFGLIIEL